MGLETIYYASIGYLDKIRFEIAGLEFHQRKCDFRQIQCPDLDCSRYELKMKIKNP